MIMAVLFGKGRIIITEHNHNVFSESELGEAVDSRKFRLSTPHGALEKEQSLKEIEEDIKKLKP